MLYIGCTASRHASNVGQIAIVGRGLSTKRPAFGQGDAGDGDGDDDEVAHMASTHTHTHRMSQEKLSLFSLSLNILLQRGVGRW